MQAAAQLPHARRHAGNTDARRELGTVGQVRRGLQTKSVIPDDNVQSIADAPEVDPGLRRGGMPMHVGEGLLHDAQDQFLRKPGELIDCTGRA